MSAGLPIGPGWRSIDLAGTLTILDFRDPADVITTPWDVPGLIGAGWSPDSGGLFVARRVAPDTVEVTERRLDGTDGPAQVVDIGPPPPESYGPEMIELLVAPDGRRAVLAGVFAAQVAATPAADPSASPAAVIAETGPLPTLSTSPLTLLGPLAWGSGAWSSDSRTFAWQEEGAIVIADAQGRTRLPLDPPPVGLLQPLPDGRFAVPARAGMAVIDPARSTVTAVEPDGPAAASGLWAVDGARLVQLRAIDGALQLRWFDADGALDPGFLALPDPSATVAIEPACLDVQPAPD